MSGGWNALDPSVNSRETEKGGEKREGRKKKNVVWDACFGVVGGAVSRKGSHGKQSV